MTYYKILKKQSWQAFQDWVTTNLDLQNQESVCFTYVNESNLVNIYFATESEEVLRKVTRSFEVVETGPPINFFDEREWREFGNNQLMDYQIVY